MLCMFYTINKMAYKNQWYSVYPVLQLELEALLIHRKFLGWMRL